MPDSNNQSGTQGGQKKPTLSWSHPAAAKPAAEANTQPAATNAAASTPVKTTAGETSNIGTYIGIFVGGIIIGALIGWSITGARNTANSSAIASTTATTSKAAGTTSGVNHSNSTIGPGSAVTLASNEPAGFAVAVSKASVSQPTWLVVYEDSNGAPGNAIGAALFFPGASSGTIELLRATLPGKSYFVGQSVDNGDKTFSLKNDKPVLNEQGKPLYTQFTAQ
jgi:hypothetical protein